MSLAHIGRGLSCPLLEDMAELGSRGMGCVSSSGRISSSVRLHSSFVTFSHLSAELFPNLDQGESSLCRDRCLRYSFPDFLYHESAVSQYSFNLLLQNLFIVFLVSLLCIGCSVCWLASSCWCSGLVIPSSGFKFSGLFVVLDLHQRYRWKLSSSLPNPSGSLSCG